MPAQIKISSATGEVIAEIEFDYRDLVDAGLRAQMFYEIDRHLRIAIGRSNPNVALNKLLQCVEIKCSGG